MDEKNISIEKNVFAPGAVPVVCPHCGDGFVRAPVGGRFECENCGRVFLDAHALWLSNRQLESVGLPKEPIQFSESDPTGRTAHDPGAKLDSGKNRLGLVLHGFPRALEAVGWVGTGGAEKYSPNGWMEVPDGINRYTDAMYRHFLREALGEAADRQSGLLHAAHAAWNALARLELMLRGVE